MGSVHLHLCHVIRTIQWLITPSFKQWSRLRVSLNLSSYEIDESLVPKFSLPRFGPIVARYHGICTLEYQTRLGSQIFTPWRRIDLTRYQTIVILPMVLGAVYLQIFFQGHQELHVDEKVEHWKPSIGGTQAMEIPLRNMRRIVCLPPLPLPTRILILTLLPML